MTLDSKKTLFFFLLQNAKSMEVEATSLVGVVTVWILYRSLPLHTMPPLAKRKALAAYIRTTMALLCR